MGKTPKQLHLEREKRVNDAIQLKEPDRVPIVTLFGFFPAKYAGITCEEAMFDHDKAMKAWDLNGLNQEPEDYPHNNRNNQIGPQKLIPGLRFFFA